MPVPVVAATTTEGSAPAAAPEASTAEVVEEEEPEWAQGFGLLDLLAARKGVMARLYVSAINKLLMAAPEASEIGAPLGMHELLVDSHTCCVTAKLYANEVTIGSLNLPADVIIERMTINKRNINTPATGGKRIDPDQKILKGDELTLRALPHRLVLVCDVPKGGGQLSLLTKPKTTAADAIARRRAKLLDSTVELAKGLQAIVRSRIRQRREAYQNLSALKFQRATLTHPSRLARLELAPPPQGVNARLTMATTDKGRQRVRKEGPYKRAERPKVEVVEEVKEKKKLPPEAKASHHKGKGGAGRSKGSSPSSSPKGKKAGAGKAKEGGRREGRQPAACAAASRKQGGSGSCSEHGRTKEEGGGKEGRGGKGRRSPRWRRPYHLQRLGRRRRWRSRLPRFRRRWRRDICSRWRSLRCWSRHWRVRRRLRLPPVSWQSPLRQSRGRRQSRRQRRRRRSRRQRRS